MSHIKAKEQLSTLISRRVVDMGPFRFESSEGEVKIFKSDLLLMTADLTGFTEDQIKNNSVEWKNYKTNLLNKHAPSTVNQTSINQTSINQTSITQKVTRTRAVVPSQAFRRAIRRSGGCNCGR